MGFYKSIPFEQALTKQLDRVMDAISAGSPNAINAVEALEATVLGYIFDDERYSKRSKELKAGYDEKVTKLRQRREENELSSVKFMEERKPAELEYAKNLYSEISRAMVKVGIHPARNATEEMMFETVPDEPKSDTAED